jgi:Yip1 domain
MRRMVGIIIFVVGVLLILGLVFKILPGGGGVWANSGVLALVVGAAVFGLSFIKTQQPEADAPPPLPPAERVTGVFYEPARIFQNLRYHPRWLAAFLVIALSGALYNVAFVQRVTPEAIAQTLNSEFDKLVEGGWMQPQRAEIAKEQNMAAAKSPAARIAWPLNTIGAAFLILLALATLFLLCVLIFGGRMNYWQALSAAAYSSLPPLVIANLLSIVLLYVKPLEDIDPIRGQSGLVRADLSFLFAPAEHPILFVIASFVGILSLYRLWLTATGLRETSTRLSNASAWTIALVLGGLYMLFMIIMASIFPSFVG